MPLMCSRHLLTHSCSPLLSLQDQDDSGSSPPVPSEEVPTTLLAACGGAFEPVAAAYSLLLSRPTGPHSLPPLRLRLLRSVLVALRRWAAAVVSSAVSRADADVMMMGADGSALAVGEFSASRAALVNACSR